MDMDGKSKRMSKLATAVINLILAGLIMFLLAFDSGSLEVIHDARAYIREKYGINAVVVGVHDRMALDEFSFWGRYKTGEHAVRMWYKGRFFDVLLSHGYEELTRDNYQYAEICQAASGYFSDLVGMAPYTGSLTLGGESYSVEIFHTKRWDGLFHIKYDGNNITDVINEHPGRDHVEIQLYWDKDISFESLEGKLDDKLTEEGKEIKQAYITLLSCTDEEKCLELKKTLSKKSFTTDKIYTKPELFTSV